MGLFVRMMMVGDWKQRMHELAAHLHIPADEAEQIITDAVDEVEQIITDAVASGAPEPEPEPAEVHSKVRACLDENGDGCIDTHMQYDPAETNMDAVNSVIYLALRLYGDDIGQAEAQAIAETFMDYVEHCDEQARQQNRNGNVWLNQ